MLNNAMDAATSMSADISMELAPMKGDEDKSFLMQYTTRERNVRPPVQSPDSRYSIIEHGTRLIDTLSTA